MKSVIRLIVLCFLMVLHWNCEANVITIPPPSQTHMPVNQTNRATFYKTKPIQEASRAILLPPGAATPLPADAILVSPPRTVEPFLPTVATSPPFSYPEPLQPDETDLAFSSIPNVVKQNQLLLSPMDAICLALRNNPQVLNSELNRIVDKYAVILARHLYQPQYTLSATGNIFSHHEPRANIHTSISILSPIGTQYSLSYNNPLDGSDGSATVSVIQPFGRGFGLVARIPYLDALDQELINKLTFKNQIIDVVVNVITAYRVLVADYNNLAIQHNNLKETQENLRRYRLEVKAGRLARADLIQQEANLQNAKLSYAQTQTQLQIDYQALLSTLGLIPSAQVTIEKTISISGVRLPSLPHSILIALHNNTAYQQALINLNILQRAILSAQNERRPVFNLIGSASIDRFNRPTTYGSPRTLGFELDVPIDDVAAKAQLVSAKIAYEQAQLDLAQQKEDLIRQVMTDYQTLHDVRQQINYAALLVKLQEKTLENARIRLKYGKATMFEVVQDQDELLASQVDLVAQKIQWLNLVTSFYQNLGITLDVRHIKLRY